VAFTTEHTECTELEHSILLGDLGGWQLVRRVQEE